MICQLIGPSHAQIERPRLVLLHRGLSGNGARARYLLEGIRTHTRRTHLAWAGGLVCFIPMSFFSSPSQHRSVNGFSLDKAHGPRTQPRCCPPHLPPTYACGRAPPHPSPPSRSHLLVHEALGPHEPVPPVRPSLPEGQAQHHAVTVKVVPLVARVGHLEGEREWGATDEGGLMGQGLKGNLPTCPLDAEAHAQTVIHTRHL